MWGALNPRLTSLRKKKLNTSKATFETLYNHLLGTLYCCWWSHVTPNQYSKVCDIVQSSAWNFILQLVDCMSLHSRKASLHAKFLKFIIILFFIAIGMKKEWKACWEKKLGELKGMFCASQIAAQLAIPLSALRLVFSVLS